MKRDIQTVVDHSQSRKSFLRAAGIGLAAAIPAVKVLSSAHPAHAAAASRHMTAKPTGPGGSRPDSIPCYPGETHNACIGCIGPCAPPACQIGVYDNYSNELCYTTCLITNWCSCHFC